MRAFNNTKYKTISVQDLFNDARHLLFEATDFLNLPIECVDIRDNHIELMGEDCSLAVVRTDKALKSSGTIRWFDKMSGEGAIRGRNGKSHRFFVCNAVGADSHYPHLVTTVKFEAGEFVTFELSNDPHTYRECGATNIRKAA